MLQTWQAVQRFRHLGRICLTCPQSRARQRIEEVIDVIEFQHQRIQGRRDKRLIMDISATTLQVTD